MYSRKRQSYCEFVCVHDSHMQSDKCPLLASVLKRWKLNWCDLWIDGSFMFYKSENRRDYETRVSLKTSCVNVKSGLECAGGN